MSHSAFIQLKRFYVSGEMMLIHIIQFYLPAVLLITATTFFIDWRIAVSTKRTFRPLRRLGLAFIVGIALAVMLRYA